MYNKLKFCFWELSGIFFPEYFQSARPTIWRADCSHLVLHDYFYFYPRAFNS